MKKTLFLFIALLTLALSSCNEDNTGNDSALTQQITGAWRLDYVSGVNEDPASHYFDFDSTGFTYSNTITSAGQTQMKGWTAKGTWNVRKETLQLTYDLSTLNCFGLTEDEEASITLSLKDWNANTEAINKKGRAYGYKMTFGTFNNQTTVRLSGFNGNFVRVSY